MQTKNLLKVSIPLAVFAVISLLPQKTIAGKVHYDVTRSLDGVLHAGPATLFQHKGLNILHLFGKREEMARQHAAFIRGKVKKTALNHFSHGLRQLIETNQSGFNKFKSLSYLNYLYWRLESKFTNAEKSMIQAFEEEAGMAEGEMLDAIVYPDAGELLMAKIWSEARVSLPGFSFGCTTFILNPEQSAEGGLIHARNLDFHGEGLFERNGAVIYYHPIEPGLQHYASITTLGVHVAGPTVFNESGLILDLHQLTVDETSTSGRPILMLMEEVMRKAHTFHEAIAMLRKFRFTTPWKINLSSWKEGRIALIEVSSERFNVQEKTDTGLFETNHARSGKLKPKEFFPGFQYAEDTLLRLSNVKAQIAGSMSGGGVTSQEAVDAIGSTLNRDLSTNTWKSRNIHGTVSRMDSVSSVVFVPGKETAYVAVPRFDFGKANEGSFVAVPMTFTTDPDRASRSLLKFMPVSLMAKSAPSDFQAQAHAHYRRAYAQYIAKGDLLGAIDKIEAAQKLDPEEPVYPLMIAATYLRAAGLAAKEDAYKTNIPSFINLARTGLKNVLTRSSLSSYHQSLARLLLGEIELSSGNTTSALSHFKSMNAHFSTILVEEFLKVNALALENKKIEVTRFADLGIDYVVADITKYSDD